MSVQMGGFRRGLFWPNGSQARQPRNVDPWGGGFTHYGPLVTTSGFVTSGQPFSYVTSGHPFSCVTSGQTHP